MITTRVLDPSSPEDQSKIATLEALGVHARSSRVVMVAEIDGSVAAVLLSSPVQLIHGLTVFASMNSLKAAEHLVRFAVGVGRGLGEKSAVFVVDEDNINLRRFVSDVGAISDGPPAALYHIDL